MKKQKRYMVIFAMVMIALLNGKVFADEIEPQIEYSKKYLEWMELSDEEKEGTIEPFPTNITMVEDDRTSKISLPLKSSLLPDKYDLRDYIDIEVKNQGQTEACWAYASNSVLETFLALKGEEYNFSEKHLDYSTASNFINGTNSEVVQERILTEGGSQQVSSTYYSRGSGPILEEDMPFDNSKKEIYLEDLPKEVAIKHVEDIKFFPHIYKNFDENGNLEYKDSDGNIYTTSQVAKIREDIKKHIMNYGGIAAAVYFSVSPSYYNSQTYASNLKSNISQNHAVTIVGWDDTYSRENFNNKPNSDGAYIVLNSYGNQWGDSGFYYVSYEDLLIESILMGVTQISDIDYDNIYQYDTDRITGNLYNLKYSANVFTSTADEYLTEIVIGTNLYETCDIYINKTGNDLNIDNLTKIATNVNLNAGYNTVKLTNKIELTKGQMFSIVIKSTSGENYTVGIESISEDKVSKGLSYVSKDGQTWIDLGDVKIENSYMRLSIKALTQTKGKHISVNSNLRSNSDETRINVTLSTSHLENGNTSNVQIMHKGYDVTKQFTISGNTIRGKGAFIVIKPLSSIIDSGTYTLNINLSNFKTLVQNLTLGSNSNTLDSDKYIINEGYIIEIDANTKVSEFKNNINTSLNYSINENGIEVTDNNSIIKTGQVVDTGERRYELVVTGDVNGDGKIKASDLSIMKGYMVGKRQLTGAFKKAGDLNNDGKIKASDLSLLKKKMLGN